MYDDIFKQSIKDIQDYYDKDLEHPLIVAGDTDSFFIEMSSFVQNMQEDEALDLCEKKGKQILETINKEFLANFLADKLNWNKDYIHLLIEYEALGRTYNLPVKKKYVFYQQRPKEHLDIKGMETQRSDYPSDTRERLIKIIKMLVIEQRPVEEIKQFIEDTESEFRKRLREWDKALARPVSWSKPISSYKKVPSQVIGMLIWNAIFDTDEFRPGSKGYAFRVVVLKNQMNPNLYKKLIDIVKIHSKKEKIEWLVIPEDYYGKIDIEGMYVDIDAMIKFSWLDRIDILLQGVKHLFEDKKQDLLWDL